MKQQNYKNHPQLVPGYHFVTLLLVLALLIGSVVNLLNTSKDNLYSASLICLVAVVIGLVAFYARSFALKAQDRAIRAEENFRHFFLTNKVMQQRVARVYIVKAFLVGKFKYQRGTIRNGAYDVAGMHTRCV